MGICYHCVNLGRSKGVASAQGTFVDLQEEKLRISPAKHLGTEIRLLHRGASLLVSERDRTHYRNRVIYSLVNYQPLLAKSRLSGCDFSVAEKGSDRKLNLQRCCSSSESSLSFKLAPCIAGGNVARSTFSVLLEKPFPKASP